MLFFCQKYWLWPIPRHVCYSLDSILCKLLRKLSIWKDIHTLVYWYYLQCTYILCVSIGIERFQTPRLISPHYLILLCHVCYIRRFQLFDMVQQCIKLCEVLGLWITNPYCQHCSQQKLTNVSQNKACLCEKWGAICVYKLCNTRAVKCVTCDDATCVTCISI